MLEQLLERMQKICKGSTFTKHTELAQACIAAAENPNKAEIHSLTLSMLELISQEKTIDNNSRMRYKREVTALAIKLHEADIIFTDDDITEVDPKKDYWPQPHVFRSRFQMSKHDALNAFAKVEQRRPGLRALHQKNSTFAKLLAINPVPKDGLCVEATNQVVDLLRDKKEPRNIRHIPKQDHRSDGDYKYCDPQGDNGKLDVFLSTVADNSVLVVKCEDHSFNLLKLDGELWMIDSSFGIYKRIENDGDWIYQAQDLPHNSEQAAITTLIGMDARGFEGFCVAVAGPLHDDYQQNPGEAPRMEMPHP